VEILERCLLDPAGEHVRVDKPPVADINSRVPGGALILKCKDVSDGDRGLPDVYGDGKFGQFLEEEGRVPMEGVLARVNGRDVVLRYPRKGFAYPDDKSHAVGAVALHGLPVHPAGI